MSASVDDLTNRTAIPLVPPFDFTSMLSWPRSLSTRKQISSNEILQAAPGDFWEHFPSCLCSVFWLLGASTFQYRQRGLFPGSCSRALCSSSSSHWNLARSPRFGRVSCNGVIRAELWKSDTYASHPSFQGCEERSEDVEEFKFKHKWCREEWGCYSFKSHLGCTSKERLKDLRCFDGLLTFLAPRGSPTVRPELCWISRAPRHIWNYTGRPLWNFDLELCELLIS